MAHILSAPQLIVLLNFWLDARGACAAGQPHEAVRKKLVPMGLMEYTDNGYHVTDKGDVYIRHLLSRPLPQEVPLVTWAYPEN